MLPAFSLFLMDSDVIFDHHKKKVYITPLFPNDGSLMTVY